MKKNLLLIFTALSLLVICSHDIFADEFTLDASKLVPADTGYYIRGILKDKNSDGVPELYNGCVDEYGESSHNEKGTQQGFTYQYCMIMPTCDAKGDKSAGTGYIQLRKSQNLSDESLAIRGAIFCPKVMNIQSLYLEVSSDISIKPEIGRQIYFYIHYSKDNGKTWENKFFVDSIINQGGTMVTYEKGIVPVFDSIIAASKLGSVIIRISTGDLSKPTGQRLKVHRVKLLADKPTSIKENVVDFENSFRLERNMIIANSGTVKVYNPLGQLMGQGASVAVASGVYIVRTQQGKNRKVYVR